MPPRWPASLPAVVEPPQPILAQWLASILLAAHNIEANQKPAQPTTQSPPPADSSKRLKALRQASKRSQRYTRARRKQLDEFQLQLDRIETQKAALEQEVSRKEQLIDQQMVRLDTLNASAPPAA